MFSSGYLRKFFHFVNHFSVTIPKLHRGFKQTHQIFPLLPRHRRYTYRLSSDLRSLLILSKILLHRSLESRLKAGCRKFIEGIRPPRIVAFGHDSKPASLLNFANDDKSDQTPCRDSEKQWQSPERQNDENGNRRRLKLMDYKELMWPHPIKSFRNYIFSFLIQGYYDHHFTMSNFLSGAEQAISVVSNLISKGQFENLEGLVDNEAIWELQRNYEKLSQNQRQFIAVDTRDIFSRFIYEIGMIFDDETDQRFVEITTVFQGFHELEELKQKHVGQYKEELYKSRDQVYVCNYRFIREFTKGKEDDWTINKLNHFCPSELGRTDED